MVLPTLPTYLELKKVNFNQDFIRNKNTNAFDRNEKWTNTTKYFNQALVNTAQHGAWTSDKSFNQSMHAYTRQQEETVEQKEEKKLKLKLRQNKLTQQMRSETACLEQELKNLRINSAASSTASTLTSEIGVSSSSNGGGTTRYTTSATAGQSPVDLLKQRAEILKSAREDSRKKLAEEKLYEHWRINNPELRQLESRQLNEFVVSNWENQIGEKMEEQKKIKEMDNEYVKYLDSEREKAIEKDLELKRLKLNRELELKEILKQQMIELKQKEAEGEILKREEFELIREQDGIDKLTDERKQFEQRHANQEYGRQLLRQHKAKLHKKTKEIQEALQFDLEILKQLRGIEKVEQNLEVEKRQKLKTDADYMIKVLNEQLRLEKEREAELENMFQDEASKEWDKRNAEWEREKKARENLMNQVMQERKQQLYEKFEIIKQKKIESLERREELIKDMEMTQRMAQREREKIEQLKTERKTDFERQMTARREKIQEENINNVNEFEQEQIEHQIYNNLVGQEKQKQLEVKFEPKSFGRKKVAWT